MPLTSSVHIRFIKLVLTVLISLGLFGCSLIKSHKNDDEIPAIAFEKFKLDNGLTLLVHEDHSDPLVHVDVTYHVGSARELPGKSGFAHLFEHMMFQGSQHVGDEEHFKIINAAGGNSNGSTDRDRTNYYETVPSNYLETVLWLEADRMGFFLEGITQEKFEVQRATVKNEKRQNFDNRPYGRIAEIIGENLYPAGHPYSWLTIGNMPDLDHATAADLRNFFLRWYGPNNATLTVGGDVDAQQVRRLVKKYFGPIPKGPEIPPLTADTNTLTQTKHISYQDPNIRFPMLNLVWPTVPAYHPDQPALDALADILSNGKSGVLYQQFVRGQRALYAGSQHRNYELAGSFSIMLMPMAGLTLADMEQDLLQMLNRFAETEITDEALDRYKANYEAGFINSLETVSGKVSKLAHYQTFKNDPSYYQKSARANLALTTDDLHRVFNHYIKNKPYLALSVLSQANEKPAAPDTPSTPTNKTITALPTTPPPPLPARPVSDTFDRNQKPKPQVAQLVKAPDYWRQTSANGMEIIGTRSDELPRVSIKLSLPGGLISDNTHLEKLGLADLTASLMNASTQNYSEKAMADALDKLGSDIHIHAEGAYFTINLSSLSKNLDATLALLEEKLLRPAFNKDDFARERQRALESAQSAARNVEQIANDVNNRLIYGDKHIFGIPNSTLIDSLPRITRDDLRRMHKTYFVPNQAQLVIVGDISQQQALQKLSFLTHWEKAVEEPTDLLTLTAQIPLPAHQHTQLFFVDKPGAAQAEVRLSQMGTLKYDASGDYFRRNLMNYTLGGNFNSRLNLNLREDKGLTYGIYSYFSGAHLPGPFIVSAAINPEGTGTAVAEILAEIKRFQNAPISSDELAYLKQSIGQQDALKYESTRKKADFLLRILRFNIEKGFTEKQKTIINNINAEQIQRLAQQYIQPAALTILVVGDKTQLWPQLQALNLPLIELDQEGTRR